MKGVGLVEHGFNAKAILYEELPFLVGLHPGPDPYDAPLDAFTRLSKFSSWFVGFLPFLFDRVISLFFARIMMNRAAVCKFVLDDVPAISSSSGTRSAPATPSDLPSATPRSSIIEVLTFHDEGTPF
ncbi:hypothetical protein Salat_2903100 [Sesamum alatum]|uniref:Uncharacterized protein n=1 Tax=Sesamum alatum TaxID=300844 RepID=A0AAE1XIG2_9LAMI|nr:hypothetical protein Salat_2903100 [Sesamum alatum]